LFLYFLEAQGLLEVDRQSFNDQLLTANFSINNFPRANFLTSHYNSKQRNAGDYEYYQEILEPLLIQIFSQIFPQEFAEVSPPQKTPANIQDSLQIKIPALITLPNTLFNPRDSTSILGYFNRYKFTRAENEAGKISGQTIKEMAIDPEIFGKVLENTLGVVERGKSGTVYTPKEIVQFMVTEVLARYLAQETGLDFALIQTLLQLAIENLIQQLHSDDPAALASPSKLSIQDSNLRELITISQAEVLKQVIAQVRILDPAVGSGAFLVGMFQILFAVRQILGQRLGESLERGSLGRQKIKEEIIAHNLYGIDLNPEAIEITKLRLWLGLLEETAQIGNLEKSPHLPKLPNIFNLPNLFNLPKLPNLEKKLICGNALFSDISELQLDLDTQVEGFDIVIGNPPYVRQELIKELKPALSQAYTCYTGMADLYIYFYEQGLKLLKSSGHLVYISPNKYFRSGYGAKLRELLSTTGKINILIDFKDTDIFAEIAYPSIILIQKAEPENNQVRVLNWEPSQLLNRNLNLSLNPSLNQPINQSHKYLENPRSPTSRSASINTFNIIYQNNSFLIPQSALTVDGWRLESPQVLKLLDKLRSTGIPLRQYVHQQLYRGITTGFNSVFVIDRDTKNRLVREHAPSAEVLKPFLRGRNIKRWNIHDQDLYLIFTYRGIDINKYPAIRDYLIPYKSRLTPGIIGGRAAGSYQWFELQASPKNIHRFESPKIIIPTIVKQPECYLDQNGYFCNDKASVCSSQDNEYLLGILNSKIINWFLQHIAATKREGFLELKPVYLSQIPIPIASEIDKKMIATLVQKCIEFQGVGIQVWTEAIDVKLANLYGLNTQEIQIINTNN
jgi:type I restriction-modification system DNA methylase subunit